jgi:hypothetical protein
MGRAPDAAGGHGAATGTHGISFYGDDLQATMAELRSRGVAFDGDVVDAGFGLVTHFTMPGDVRVQLYQPRNENHAAR